MALLCHRATTDPKHLVALGYSLVEALVVLALMMTLSAIAIPMISQGIDKANNSSATSDIDSIAAQLLTYEVEFGHLPDSLDEIMSPVPRDPWGNEYQYLRIRGGSEPRGHWRKDRFLVPLNSDFDLYSLGPDGQSSPPLTASASRDDIIRAGDGSYIGAAEDY
jgi:general secretion pathway protein G